MKNILRKPILLIAALASFCNLHAQSNPKSLPDTRKIHFNDLSFTAIISGNGFGVQYVPSAGIRFGKRIVIWGGPVFCSSDWKNTGYVIGTRYLLMKEEESFNGRMRLSFDLSAQRFTNACLSAGAIRTEKMLAQSSPPEQQVAYESMQFAGWEYATGFAMTYRFKFGFLIRTEAGFSYYNSTLQSGKPAVTARENKSGCLKLGVGIGWGF